MDTVNHAIELDSLVHYFESCTLPRSQWNHQAHLTVALWYLIHCPRSEAVERIRHGIQRYNMALGIQTTRNSGYHETLTRFWIHAVYQFVTTNQVKHFTPNAVDALVQEYGDPNLPLQYYSRDLLMSWEARSEWVKPDLQPLPA